MPNPLTMPLPTSPPRARPTARRCVGVLAIALAVLSATAAGAQQDPRVQRGEQFARTNCAMCHAVGRFGDSPLAIAPPFRTLSLRYPVEDLEEALAEGVVTGHPTMPQFQLDGAQIADFIAYLKTLEK